MQWPLPTVFFLFLAAQKARHLSMVDEFLWKSQGASTAATLLPVVNFSLFTDLQYRPSWHSGPWRVPLSLAYQSSGCLVPSVLHTSRTEIKMPFVPYWYFFTFLLLLPVALEERLVLAPSPDWQSVVLLFMVFSCYCLFTSVRSSYC